ncbi:hypothetical protein C8J57DRAFT_1228827 [Mycena rebaudengoi]|nr:hypothetical protein C8J57DRAFT_1228827 [Mycena rebaudengoi]
MIACSNLDLSSIFCASSLLCFSFFLLCSSSKTISPTLCRLSVINPTPKPQAFSADELLLFGNSEEDWTTETLSEVLKADHGFNGESRAICDLVEILSEYDPMTRNYLQFMTGVQGKLPFILRS